MPVFIKGAGKSPKGTAVVGDVISGKTFSNDSDVGLTGTMSNNGAVMITPGTSNQVIAAGFHNGSGVVAGDADLIAANILTGKNIFGVDGTAKRSATGTGSTPTSGGVISVSGLGFTPSKIIIYQWRTSMPSSVIHMKVYVSGKNNTNLTHDVSTGMSTPQDKGAWTIGSGSFSTVVYNLGWDDVVYQYFAFE